MHKLVQIKLLAKKLRSNSRVDTGRAAFAQMPIVDVSFG